jgi:hypothetical protein
MAKRESRRKLERALHHENQMISMPLLLALLAKEMVKVQMEFPNHYLLLKTRIPPPIQAKNQITNPRIPNPVQRKLLPERIPLSLYILDSRFWISKGCMISGIYKC